MRKSFERYLDRGPIYLGYRLGQIKATAACSARSSTTNPRSCSTCSGGSLATKRSSGHQAVLHEWRFKKAGTDDFRAAFEAETPMKLERFFERWIQGFGRPRLHIAWRNDDAGSSRSR